MNIIIMPYKIFKREINFIDKANSCAVICSSYDIDEAPLKALVDYVALNFDDVAFDSTSSFNYNLAGRIKALIDSMSDEELFVCCDSGESRSSAITAAIHRYKGEDDMYIWQDPYYHPNPYVFSIMCKKFGVEVSEADVDRLVQINENSFKEFNVNKRVRYET